MCFLFYGVCLLRCDGVWRTALSPTKIRFNRVLAHYPRYSARPGAVLNLKIASHAYVSIQAVHGCKNPCKFGRVGEWLIPADCKSAAPCGLRRFESSPVHQFGCIFNRRADVAQLVERVL